MILDNSIEKENVLTIIRNEVMNLTKSQLSNKMSYNEIIEAVAYQMVTVNHIEMGTNILLQSYV